jgi:hypothetical protein
MHLPRPLHRLRLLLRLPTPNRLGGNRHLPNPTSILTSRQIGQKLRRTPDWPPKTRPLSHISTRVHTICTTSAPCRALFTRLPLQKCAKIPQNRLLNSASTVPIRKNPQQNPYIFADLLVERRVNRGIRTANTICCALYLTHPTKGGTFTTAAHLGTDKTYRSFQPSPLS